MKKFKSLIVDKYRCSCRRQSHLKQGICAYVHDYTYVQFKILKGLCHEIFVNRTESKNKIRLSIPSRGLDPNESIYPGTQGFKGIVSQ